jgi:hypothetical protein
LWPAIWQTRVLQEVSNWRPGWTSTYTTGGTFTFLSERETFQWSHFMQKMLNLLDSETTLT